MPYKFLDKYSDLIMQNKVEIRNKILSLNMDIEKSEEKISLLEKQKANSMIGFSPFAVDRDFDREISAERDRIVELENEIEEIILDESKVPPVVLGGAHEIAENCLKGFKIQLVGPRLTVALLQNAGEMG